VSSSNQIPYFQLFLWTGLCLLLLPADCVALLPQARKTHIQRDHQHSFLKKERRKKKTCPQRLAWDEEEQKSASTDQVRRKKEKSGKSRGNMYSRVIRCEYLCKPQPGDAGGLWVEPWTRGWELLRCRPSGFHAHL
jgi:hypothetical protein